MKYNGKKVKLTMFILGSILVIGGCSKEKVVPKGSDVTLTENGGSEEVVETSLTEEVLDETVVSVGNKKISYAETMIYVRYIKTKYEVYFGKTIWDYDFGGQTFEDMAKEEIMDMITQTAIISGQSDREEYSIELTDEEEHNISLAADRFLEKLTKKDKAKYGFTKERIEKFYRDNKLYERVYDAESMNVDTEVSNEEARRIKLNYIYLTTTKKDASNETVSMSKEEKEKVFEKAKEIYQLGKEMVNTMEDENSFLDFAKKHSQLEEVEVIFGKEEGEISFAKEGLELNSRELSDIIEKEEGYYILYCVTDFDKDATLEVKESIIAERQNQNFKKVYKEWASKEEVKIKNKVWDEIHLSEVDEELDEIKNPS